MSMSALRLNTEMISIRLEWVWDFAWWRAATVDCDCEGHRRRETGLIGPTSSLGRMR